MAFACSLAIGGAARAGIYTDDLSKCLVKATTDADRLDLMVWIFDALASHPAVSSRVTITPAQREDSDRRAAKLLTRLLVEDCRSQTIDGVKYEGASAIQQSFTVLGQVAVGGLTSDPSVSKNIAGMAQYMDQEKFKKLLSDSGAPQPPAKK